MNWGHQLKELVIHNWREKIISLLLAFLFWFMIKAQDARRPAPYPMAQPAPRMPVTPAPSQLEPVLPPPVEVPSELSPALVPEGSSDKPATGAGASIGKATGL